MSKAVKTFALLSTVCLTGLSVASLTLVWRNWDLIWGRELTASLEEKTESLSQESEKNLISNPDEREVNKLEENKEEPASTQTLFIRGLKVELLDCTSKEIGSSFQTIACPYLVTSEQANTRLRVSSGRNKYNSVQARLIDGSGREYLSTRINLGSTTDSYQVTKSLVKDIPIRGTIVFDNVPNEIEDIKLLEMFGHLNSSLYTGNLRMQFRDITFSES